MPARLTLIEARYAMAAGSLPPPNVVLPKTLGIDEMPAIIVATGDTVDIDDAGNTPGGREYRVRYRMRLVVYARGESYTETDQRQKRYTLAARELLLGRKAMGSPPKGANVHTPTWRESFSEIQTEAKTKRVLGVALVEFELTLAEVLA